MEMKFNSQICTSIEQSSRLLALGLKKETADCYHWQETEPMYGEAAGIWHLETLDSKDNQEHFEYLDKYFGVCLADDEEHYFIPAWSLHRIINLIPERISICGLEHKISIREYSVRYVQSEESYIGRFYGENLYDMLITCIEWLINGGYFNKEYLNENI